MNKLYFWSSDYYYILILSYSNGALLDMYTVSSTKYPSQFKLANSGWTKNLFYYVAGINHHSFLS